MAKANHNPPEAQNMTTSYLFLSSFSNSFFATFLTSERNAANAYLVKNVFLTSNFQSLKYFKSQISLF